MGSQLELSQSQLDLNQSNLDLRLSQFDLNQSKLDPRLLQPVPRLLLSSSSDSSQFPSQEERGRLPSQHSLAELPGPDLSRDLSRGPSWESPHSSRVSSLSLPSLTAGSSPDLRRRDLLSADSLRLSLLS